MSHVSPFRMTPFFRTRIWGFHDLAPWYDFKTTGEPVGEVWLTGESECKVASGPFAGQSLQQVTAEHGKAILGTAYGDGEFPLLIKLLFPKEKLSVQVHPDDELAQKYGEPRGKTECWFALDAKPGAAVALGIKAGATVDQIKESIPAGTLEDLLEMVPVEKGDMLFVDAGTVHAMGPGVVILETQQTSDRTYRLYDYGRPRELHLEKSFEAMRLKTKAGKIVPKQEKDHSVLLDEKYFEIERWPLAVGDGTSLVKRHEAVQILFVASGELMIHSENREGAEEQVHVGRCELAIIPASAKGVRVEVTDAAEVVRIVPRVG